MWGQDFSYAFKFILLALRNKSFNRGDQRSSKRKIFRRNRKGTWPLLVCTGEAFRMFRISGRMWEEACMITYQLLNHSWGIFFFFYVDVSLRLHPTSNPAAARVSVSHINYTSVIPFAFIIWKPVFRRLPKLTHGKLKNPGRLLQSFTHLSLPSPRGGGTKEPEFWTWKCDSLTTFTS